MQELSPGVALARDLIKKASVTPADAGALDVLQHRLEAAGFVCRRLPFSEPDTPDIDNLYARIGTGAPYLLFAGHTDVVPPGDSAKWRADPFAGEILDGELFGRGAADMKGGIAAFAAAALAYLAENPAARFDRLFDHRRRGRAGDQRHRQNAGVDGGAGRKF